MATARFARSARGRPALRHGMAGRSAGSRDRGIADVVGHPYWEAHGRADPDGRALVLAHWVHGRAEPPEGRAPS